MKQVFNNVFTQYSVLSKKKKEKNYQIGFWKDLIDISKSLEELEIERKTNKKNDFSLALSTDDGKLFIIEIPKKCLK